MNTRMYPRQLSEAFPTAADRAGWHVYPGPPRWIRPLKRIGIALCIACTCWLLIGCSGPTAQQEAEDVADDAQTAQMQAAIDARCHSRAAHEQLACAVDALAELQPDRWIPEDAARAALAVPYAINE